MVELQQDKGTPCLNLCQWAPLLAQMMAIGSVLSLE